MSVELCCSIQSSAAFWFDLNWQEPVKTASAKSKVNWGLSPLPNALTMEPSYILKAFWCTSKLHILSRLRHPQTSISTKQNSCIERTTTKKQTWNKMFKCSLQRQKGMIKSSSESLLKTVSKDVLRLKIYFYIFTLFRHLLWWKEKDSKKKFFEKRQLLLLSW